MKHVDVLYLCDGKACEGKQYISCREDGLCRYTTKPEHAVNGYCERPDLDYDRFDEVSRFGFEGVEAVYYRERDDYVGGEVKA